MRLFLSSYRAGNHSAELLSLAGDIREIGVISNAKDYHPPERRTQKMVEVADFFKSIGLVTKEIDLRHYFGNAGVEEELASHKFIWLTGGNAFLLRRALSYTNADKFLINKVREGSIVYGGESAGAIMAGPTLRGSEDDSTNEDDPHYTPHGYDKEVLWDGLNLLDYMVVPHYKSPDIGNSIDGYIDYLKKEKIPFKAITDEQAVLVDGEKQELLK